MNYIKHMSIIFEIISIDDRLFPTHISLYMALFQFWNINRFNNPVSICRGEVKQLSKIGSNNTYHKCIKDLDKYGYIKYIPSYNPMRGSDVHMYNFDTTSVQAVYRLRLKSDTSIVQALRPPINILNNINKTKKTASSQIENKIPPEEENVIRYFKSKGSTATEAEKYINYYRANGWKVGKSIMQDWQAAARNWIIKSNEYSTKNNFKKDKNYGEPL